jgi:thiol-disulfide isomerase/thioredoxin
MSSRSLTIIAVFVLIVVVIIAAVVWTLPMRQQANGPALPPGLAHDGAFGFPQAEAQVLFDDPNLRVSLFNDAHYLYVQAIVWNDADDTLGETEDGRAIGDRSYVHLDVDANAVITPQVDRVYSVNIWPHRQGLHYQVHLGNQRRTHLADDSAGRGCIKYVDAGNGTLARVDSFLIPLAEIGRGPGETVRLAFWARSQEPPLTLNSLGLQETDPYSGYTMPWQVYHQITLADRGESVDPTLLPSGRKDVPAKPLKPVPRLGAAPPELFATEWINTDTAPTLAALRGQVVLIDFWTSTCATCISLIPHLNEMQQKYGPRGLRVLGFTHQSRNGVDWFMQTKGQPIHYTIGAGSELKVEYGVRNVPYAFIVGRDGRLLWHGPPTARELESRVLTALGGR